VTKVHVDAEACVGHGRCYALAPELFASDDHGHCIVLHEDVDTDDLLAKARVGASNCPEGAITLDEDA